MNHGRRSGLFVALGLATTDTLFAAAATAGLAALVGQNILLVTGISLLGGLWFIYRGLRLLLNNNAQRLPHEEETAAGALSAMFAYRLGFTAGAFNPQPIIFFSSVFLAALSSNPSHPGSVALIAGVAGVSAFTRCNIVLVITVKPVMKFYARQRRRVEAVSGGALTGFGLELALRAAAVLAPRVLAL